jgi:G6PDH family F420-dependent oxidoreductase
MRIHPAILAQAAATSAAMLPGRFWFGVGTGERLNEHILGDPWPEYDQRAEMLEEAIEMIRELWRGTLTSFHGDFFDVVNARIYTLPEEPPPILVAAGGQGSAMLAGRIGDGLISTAPEAELVEAFRTGARGNRHRASSRTRTAARDDRPRIGQVAVCWAKNTSAARRTAHEWWPTAAIEGDNGQELALPSSFESLAALVDEEAVAKRVICGPDPEPYVAAVGRFADAGYDHVYFHQIGPDQEGFLRFAERELLPVASRAAQPRFSTPV